MVWILVNFNIQECKILHMCKYARSSILHHIYRGNEETGSQELHISNIQGCKILHICNCAIYCSFHTCKILFIYISLFITPMCKVQSARFCTIAQSKNARFCTLAYAQSARCCTLEVQFLAFLHTKKCNISKCEMLTLYERL